MRRHTKPSYSITFGYFVATTITCMLVVICCLLGNESTALAASHPTAISDSGVDLIASFEGFREKAYKNLGETYYTIGYGHYGSDVKPGQTITKTKALELLRTDATRYADAVSAFLDQNDISLGQNQFDALTSYTYNRGAYVWTSKEAPIEILLKEGYQNHTAAEITSAFVNSWGSNANYEKGLKDRRRKEADYFLKDLSAYDNDLAIDSSYPTPMSCYPLATSGKVTVYNASGVAYSKSSAFIAAGDQCTITAVYTNGLCKVTYPSSASGTGYRTLYAHFSDFSNANVTPYHWSPSGTVKSYTKSDLASVFGEIWTTDSCTVIAKSGNLLQVVYPLDGGGYKLGWVSASGVPSPPSIPDHVDIPGPITAGIFDGKSIVAMAPQKISFSSSEYIDAGDVCILSNVNSSTGYCDVTYPSGGDDVFTSVKKKTRAVAMTEFVEYQPSFKMQMVTTDEAFTVYPTSDMQTFGRAWYLDPGDEYRTVARAGSGATEVLYYCTRGVHQGYWKLGWVDLPYYWLDLNGWLDGVAAGDLGSYGAVDVYVNGNRLAERARDFYSPNGTFPKGSSYEIKNITTATGYVYNGIHSGKASGTMKSNVSVFLDFAKDSAYSSEIRIKRKPNKVEFLEGESFDSAGLAIESIAADGSGTNVTSKCGLSGYDSTPGIKTITVTYNGKSTAFTVMVKGKTPTKLTVTSPPARTEYKLGEELNFTGLEISVTYNNGTSSVVDNYNVAADKDVTSTVGSRSVPVSYEYNGIEVSTTFNISVVGDKTYPAGDVNGDGCVNNKDLTRLFQFLSDWDVEVVEGNLDVNGDGSVNNKDLTRLFQFLSDWDVELHGGE